jgi:hypothetical protein
MSTESDLTAAEMDSQEGAELPDKEAMSLLDLNVDLDLALDLAAPVDAAVAANANVAAPIDASVAANVVSEGATAYSSASQDSVIVQDLDGVAEATAIQDADIDQSGDGLAADAEADATTDEGA